MLMPLDYSTKQGVAIFDTGCASLSTKYNLGQAGLVGFIRELQGRAGTEGWSAGTQNITCYLNSDGVKIHIITAYCLIDNCTLKTATDPFILPVEAEYATRKSQKNAQMCCCLMATLTKDDKV